MHICPQEAYSWPFATLRRFEIFLKQEQALRGFDYIFFFNANAQFMQPVTREMLLPRAEKGTAARCAASLLLRKAEL